MSRRSPRLALLRSEGKEVVAKTEIYHTQRVIAYYGKVLETVRDPNERMSTLISVLEFAFQSWPTLNTQTKSGILKMIQELETGLPEMNEVEICKKLRITLLLQAIQALV